MKTHYILPRPISMLGATTPFEDRDSLFPIDIHCSAQGIITCLKLQKLDERSLPLAEKIAKWAIENMQDKKGFSIIRRKNCIPTKSRISDGPRHGCFMP